MNNIDLNTYIPLPLFSVAGALSVTEALLQDMPKVSSPGVVRAAKNLRESGEELRLAWKAKAGEHASKLRRKRRQADRSLDLAWSLLRSRLDACSRMPDDVEPMAERAGQLIDQLWPHGLRFLHDDYFDELAESKRLIDLIDQNNWADDIDAAAGTSAYLAFVRRSHDEQQILLGESSDGPKVYMGELLQRLRERMAAYVLQLVGLAAANPPARQAVREALSSIELYREISSEHHDQSEDEPDLPPSHPEQPLPAVRE